MKRLLMVVATLGSLAPAYAWESVCFEYADPNAEPGALTNPSPCEPAAGPNTARQRWVGALDEHRSLWEETRERAGIPAALSGTMQLQVFTSSAVIPSGGESLPTLVPAPFTMVERAQTRAFSVGELAQLPDFSFALWDWALGHETCPLGALGVDATACHDFATHMGPVNSNHFLPQASAFYARYHALALQRAAACKQMTDAVGAANVARFADYLRACEVQALALEAVGQHYLQDAWSSGHMWERWGAPDLERFSGANAEEQRERAVLIALASGLIHGSRAVLQKLPQWTSFDVNDAMCAPHADVQFVTHDGALSQGLGDQYASMLSMHTVQSERFFSCAASGMLDVYEATGRVHGAIGTGTGGWQRVDPVGPGCFGQRATNAAVLAGMGIQMKLVGQQIELPLDGQTVSWMVPKVAETTGGAAVESSLKHRFRLELMRMVSVARIVARDAPHGTELATGRLGSFLGSEPNGAHLKDPGNTQLASYLEPPLPWPKPVAGTATELVRAQALARTFHRAHAADWCSEITTAELDELKARASDTALDAATREAACSVCSELSVRHLRVGDSTSWDATREPLCHSLVASPAYVYQAGSAVDSPAALARAWCGCPG